MLLVLDCNYICYVCAFALSTGLSYHGGRTEVVFGFFKQMLTLCEQFEPTQIAFCWDSKISKRREIYPEYKSNRRKELTEDEQEALALVYEQFDDLKNEVLSFLGFVNIFCIDGFESDDLIASTVKSNYFPPDKTVVVTSDTDLYQLLDDCSIYSITKKQTTDRAVFLRNYGGISPLQWVSVKAMAGCSTDNVKGIVGVGEKKAVDYLTGKLNHGKIFAKIQESQTIIDRNMQLVKLPFKGTLTPRLRRNCLMMDKFQMICQIYGMQSFLEKKNLARWEKAITRID